MVFKGTVYAIKSLTSNYIYIGSTKQSLSIRYSKHKHDSKNLHRMKPIHKIILQNGGFDNFQIKTLKEVNCNSLIELQLYEKKIIDNYKDNNSFVLMNKQLL